MNPTELLTQFEAALAKVILFGEEMAQRDVYPLTDVDRQALQQARDEYGRLRREVLDRMR